MHSSHPDFRAPDAAMEREIQDVIEQLTLEEKITLLGGARPEDGEAGNTRSVARLGIPSLRMADASQGVHWWIDDTTTFPSSLALAASFDVDLAEEYARAIAADCRAAGVHILLGPGLNLYRSPLCGRNFEYFGEDPYLTSRMTVHYVKALQSQRVAATLKHYAVNFQEYDRNKVSSDVDERTLREVYLRGFEAGVIEGGAGAVMTGYNLVNGLHCAEHPHLINTILKGDWGFDGVVMSDWVSVYDALNTAKAGLDLEMPWAEWLNHEHLVPAVRDGRLDEAVLDDKVRRQLRLAKAFGWVGTEQKIEDPLRNIKNAQVALKVAEGSIVLLKNDGLLPLRWSEHKTIAVIGPNSDPAVVCGGGSGFNKGWRQISFLDGIRNEVPAGTRVVHARGIDAKIAFDAFEQAQFLQADGSEGVRTEYFATNDLSGTPVLERLEPRVNFLWKADPIGPDVPKENFSIRFTALMETAVAGTTDFYLHVWDGASRLWVDEVCVFDVWNREAFGDHWVAVDLAPGKHRVRMEFRNIRGWNSCCLGWDSTGRKQREYQSALTQASVASAVVFCGGFNHRNEAEGADRTFGMPADVERLLLDVLDRNKQVIVVLNAGGNLDMRSWHDRCAALIHTWYPGQEGGTALARILSGTVNPSGRLPATFEAALEDRLATKSYHDHDGDLRVLITDGVFGGYKDFDRSRFAPRYPFGFGLSYTTFAYESLRLSRAVLKRESHLTLSLDVINSGGRPGSETVQLYIGSREPVVPRPVKELRGFLKVALAPGERRTVHFEVRMDDLRRYDVEQGRWVFDFGVYTVFVGASVADIRLTEHFAVLS